MKQRKTPFFLANNKYSTRGKPVGELFSNPLLTPFPYQGNSNVLFSLIRTLASPKVLPFGKEKKKNFFSFAFRSLNRTFGFAESTFARQ
ncbi:MAG: hypothetical protein IKH91_07925 [Prevotella sp.]|nr:hypothetical protein [Prevotella sp.]